MPRPYLSGRTFDIFIDANDYDRAAVLCQRETPHGAPTIIDIMTKRGFHDVQLRLSAMGRELYALWQGVVGFDKLINFGVHTYVYMDHKTESYPCGTVA